MSWRYSAIELVRGWNFSASWGLKDELRGGSGETHGERR